MDEPPTDVMTCMPAVLRNILLADFVATLMYSIKLAINLVFFPFVLAVLVFSKAEKW